MMHCFSLNAQKAMISRTLKLFEIYDLDALEPYIDVYEITRYNLGIFKLVENRTKILK
jgi:hypothetical protein